MDLIDKDALIESFRETVTHAFEWKERVKGDEITSLCADRAIIDFTEAKLRVESMPTVDAIPVNWLTNLAKEYEKSDNQFFRMDSCVIEDLIKRWKAEQEKQNDS